jgi:putative lipoprotein
MLQPWVNLLAGLVVGAVASQAPALAAGVTLSGEVTYRERLAMPDGARLRVRLIDLTAPGTPTRVQAEAPIARPGQVPLTFTLNFDDRALVRGNQHALVAEILAGLELWFRNVDPYRLDPLAPQGPVMIITGFAGRLIEAGASQAIGEAGPSAPTILDVTWRVESIDGEPVRAEVESTLSIASDMRAGGRGGCNNYFAQAQIGGETISFSAIAATRMACLSNAATAQETAFFAALEATRFWRMNGEELLLLDESGDELVHFVRAAR